jgi:group I intron endonuclease
MQENHLLSGVYSILNNQNNKLYIGSSKNIGVRFKRHISLLKNNKHFNSHLQASVNKYGLECFSFHILKEIKDNSKLIQFEQLFINQFSFDSLYNLTKVAGSGGGDSTGKTLLLLNLKGDIIKKFTSGLQLSKFINSGRLNYKRINTDTIIKKKYRVVTPDYYQTNNREVLRWKIYTSESKEKSRLFYREKYKLTKNDTKICFSFQTDVAQFLGLTPQRIQQIINQLNNQEVKKYFHKKTGYCIELS